MAYKWHMRVLKVAEGVNYQNLTKKSSHLSRYTSKAVWVWC